MRLRLRPFAELTVILAAVASLLPRRAQATSFPGALFGGAGAAQAVELGCSAQPTAVHPGELVVISGTALHLSSKAKPDWQWTTDGGVAQPKAAEVAVDTSGVPPGRYEVHGRLTAGPRPRDQASCVVAFQVKGFDPPSVSCTAEPGTVVSGAQVSVSATGTSPQKRRLTYSYAASAGTVTGSGETATLSTAGLGSTTAEITCSVMDDVGQTASFMTRVTVAQPEEPVIPQTEELCSLAFTRDKGRPVRVDNEAKACLDDLALRLTRQADARLVMIGNASPEERPETAAQRVLNAREYLLAEKGIERSRLEVRVGETSGRSVRDVLVPSGASFFEPSTQSFEERAITQPGEAYGRERSRQPHRALPATTPLASGP